jgi:hypothetical protein
MLQRHAFELVMWLTRDEAINLGLEWGPNKRGGQSGKRPFVDIYDHAIPDYVKSAYFPLDLRRIQEEIRRLRKKERFIKRYLKTMNQVPDGK